MHRTNRGRGRIDGLAGKIRPGRKRKGKDRPYWAMTIDGKQYPVSRLLYLWVDGEFPPHQMDHINRR